MSCGSLVLRIHPHIGNELVPFLLVEHAIKIASQFSHLLTGGLLAVGIRLQLAKEVSVFVQVVYNGVIRETLNALLHLQVLVNRHFEAPSHFLVLYFVFLPGKLLFLQVDNVGHLGGCVEAEAFVYFFLNKLHFLHHKSLLPPTSLHVINTLGLDAVENLLLRGLIDVV